MLWGLLWKTALSKNFIQAARSPHPEFRRDPGTLNRVKLVMKCALLLHLGAHPGWNEKSPNTKVSFIFSADMTSFLKCTIFSRDAPCSTGKHPLLVVQSMLTALCVQLITPCTQLLVLLKALVTQNSTPLCSQQSDVSNTQSEQEQSSYFYF